MSYNGHKNWNHWNVSLWINNDEMFYRQARQCIKATRNREEAAKMFVKFMTMYGMSKTPDGAPWTKTSVRAAMVEMWEEGVACIGRATGSSPACCGATGKEKYHDGRIVCDEEGA